MARVRVKLPAWSPDFANSDGANLEIADNVLPSAEGYRPLSGFVPLPGTALPGYPLGGGSFLNAARVTTTFAGTATNLYTYSAAGWSSVGSGYAASDANPWSFEQFGQWVIASNGVDAPQRFVLGGASAFDALPGVTADGVTTNPPRFKLMAIVANFLMVGVVDGSASTVAWSGINNASEWRYGIGQSDIQPLADGGDVTAIAGGEYGLIFQADAIRRATYVGGNVIFQLDVISPNVGCLHPRAFAQVGRLSFFLSSRGFMMCDGSTVTPIGDEMVDRTFLAAADRAYLGRMSCVADPVRKVVYWTVPGADPGQAFAYSWALQRWSRAVMPLRLMFAGRSRDISLDEEYGSPDTLYDVGLSFDDPSYVGGDSVLYAFNGSNAVGSLSGPAAAAKIALGPMALAGEGRRTRSRRWRMDSDAVAGVTLTIDGRQRMGDAAALTTHTGPNATGDIVARRQARTMAPSFEIAAGTAWTFFNGFSVEVEAGGGR
jgi:hypothetical protein